MKTPIPGIIKRNTVLISITQALFSGVFQSIVVIAALSLFFFTGSPALGALASSIVIGGRVIVAYGAGRLMDRIGRKTVLYLGIVIICVALAIMTSALFILSAWQFWIGIFIFGIGAGIMNMLRVPITDMYPASRRGEGMGYMLTGSIMGTIMPPALSALAFYFGFTSIEAYATIMLLSIPLILSGIVFVKLIKPDTREILRNLKSYYPQEASPVGVVECNPGGSKVVTNRNTILLAAFVSSSFGWGGMVMGMTMVSIMLQQFGVALTLINLAVSIHVIGMYGLSIPWGWLTDRRGRRLVIALGGVILGAGAFIMPITREYLIVTFGVFLIGLGWSATNVASTALICDVTPGPKRGSIMGANDVANGLASLTFPSLGGAILSSLGFLAFGVTGLMIAVPIVLSVFPIREPSR
jgi:MFS family permease